jgi:hypothetical protein
MRPIDSAYDRNTAALVTDDPGPGRYALISDHNGPCSTIGQYASLDAAIESAREMDTDAAPTDLEDDLGVCAMDMADPVSDLIAAAEAQGWRVVASAPAGEYWTVCIEA